MATSLLQWLLQTDYKDKGVKDAQKDLQGLKKGAADMVKQFTGFAMTGGTVIGVVAGLGAAVKKSVDYYVEYTDQIREATNLTGMSAEETSRLVNVADDYGITTEKLTTAMEQANKKGFLPSIENLAALSDEYLATENPLEANQLLTDKLGKSGMELVEIMKLGGDAIRDKAAAVEDGMIVDEKALAAGMAYKQSVDDLEDSFNALKLEIARGVVPVLTEIIDAILELPKATKEAKLQLEEQRKGVVLAAESYDQYKESLEPVIAGEEKIQKILRWSGASYTDIALQTYGAKEATELLTQAEFDLIRSQEGLDEMLKEGIAYFGDLGTAAEETTVEIVNFTDESKALKEAIAGPVGKELDSYADTLKDIAEKTQEAKDKTAELIAIPVEDRTEEQKKAIDEYNESVEQLGIEAEKAAKKHHEAMAKIVYDMATVQAQADGVITEAEYMALDEYARRMGIVDQSTLDAQYAMQVMGDELKQHPEFYENSARAMEAMTRALDDGYISADELTNIMRTLTGGTWNVSVGVNVDDSELDEVLQRIIRGATLNVGVGYNDNPIPMAEGGEGVVNRPTLFLAGEAGPEYFNFTPMKPGESKGGGSGVTINMYGSINNGMELEEFAQYVLKRIR